MKPGKKILPLYMLLCAAVSFTACGGAGGSAAENSSTENAGTAASPPSTLIYGSTGYTRINPAMDEHGEISLLLFDGLTAHDENNQIIPGLAEKWDYDAAACTYTFYLEKGVRWHDGEAFDAEDVKFTIEAIMDPDNGSENAPDFEDVQAVTVEDPHTVTFLLSAPDAAFLDDMSIPILPQHLLEGEDMQTSGFFRNPTGTGPYRLQHWDDGQAITLVKNEDYFKGAASIDSIIFKFVPDDQVRALQIQTGELDLALLTPRDAENLNKKDGLRLYHMQTSDYRGIMFNFNHPFWQQNRDLIPAVCHALDREAILDAVLLGHGTAAYGPLQRNIYNYEHTEHYDYNPAKAAEILEAAGWTKASDGFYYRDRQKAGFVISVAAGDQVRLDMAQAAAQQLKEAGIDCSVEIPAQVDWNGQMAYLIGWGSPFDADDHTYKVFGTGKGANYSGYSNAKVDRYLLEARQSEDPEIRAEAYKKFQKALADDPAFAFICYVDADYASTDALKGISEDTVLGHHGTGIFRNVTEWTLNRTD